MRVEKWWTSIVSIVIEGLEKWEQYYVEVELWTRLPPGVTWKKKQPGKFVDIAKNISRQSV